MAQRKDALENASENKAKVVELTLEQYTQRNKVNIGTIASFKYEAMKVADGLKPRSKEAWDKAIKAQEKKEYN